MLVFMFAVSACFSTGETVGCGEPWRVSACTCGENGPAFSRSEDEPADPLYADGVLAIRIDHEPGTLLSILDPDPVVKQIADHDILETLVRTSPDGRDIEPELAVSWIEDPTDSLFSFALNPEARWHDGKKVTAADVKFTFEKLLDPAEEASLRQEFLDVASVDVADELTVEVRLDHPRPNFLLALSNLTILPAHVFGRTPLIQHEAARAPVGSGPFAFSRWLPDQFIEIKRNPDWRGIPPGTAKILYKIVPDTRVAFDLFKRGDLDIVPDPPAMQTLAALDWRLVAYPLPRVEAWAYNVERPVFSRTAARRAVGSLIDTAAIRCSILGCRADAVDSSMPFVESTNMEGGSDIRFDPQKAVEILKQDGWVDVDENGIRERNGVELSFDLLLPDMSPDLKRTAVVVQNDLAQAGVQMRLAMVSWGVYLEQLKNGRFDAAMIAVSTSAPFSPLSLFHSRAIGEGLNYGRFSDSEVDALFNGLQGAEDGLARRGIEERLKKRLEFLHPFTFTFKPHGTALVYNHVRGVRIRDGWFDERYLWRGPSKARSAP
jgi:peptide/nickel transport system substrate-binding protein